MLEEIYRWIQNISVYLIVMAAVMHAIPGKDYGKYIRFFSGLVLILMLSSPLLRLAGMEGTFRTRYNLKDLWEQIEFTEIFLRVITYCELSVLLCYSSFPSKCRYLGLCRMD